MIYTLQSLIPSSGTSTNTNGKWVAAMPLPWYPGYLERLHDAWEVLRGRAVAMKYPEAGDFETAMLMNGWPIRLAPFVFEGDTLKPKAKRKKK